MLFRPLKADSIGGSVRSRLQPKQAETRKLSGLKSTWAPRTISAWYWDIDQDLDSGAQVYFR